jgi:hypothetical protein
MNLPEHLLAAYINRGSIIHKADFDDIDHGKFFAIIGVTEDSIAGFFFINSRIHPALQNKPAQFAMQYPLLKRHYDFLRYDSFLCATNIVTIPVTALAHSLHEGTAKYVGALIDEDLSNILDACRQSPLFSKIEKRRFFY